MILGLILIGLGVVIIAALMWAMAGPEVALGVLAGAAAVGLLFGGLVALAASALQP